MAYIRRPPTCAWGRSRPLPPNLFYKSELFQVFVVWHDFQAGRFKLVRFSAKNWKVYTLYENHLITFRLGSRYEVIFGSFFDNVHFDAVHARRILRRPLHAQNMGFQTRSAPTLGNLFQQEAQSPKCSYAPSGTHKTSIPHLN